MLSQNNSASAAQPRDSGNAIILTRKLVDKLTSTINKGKRPIDMAASARDCIDAAVSQMSECFGTHPVYYNGARDVVDGYKYFGSEMSRYIAAREDLVDKGRYVEACIVGYLFGGKGVHKLCTSARLVKPRYMSPQERDECCKAAAEIADVKSVESAFAPASLQDDI